MKFKYQMLASLFVLALPVISFGQEDSKEKGGNRRPNMARAAAGSEAGGPQGGMMGMPMSPIMIALDTDHDGTLSIDEIANASKTLLQLDKNGDGILSADELRPDPKSMPGAMAGLLPGAGGAPGQAMGKLFEARDKNGDGKLSGDEIPERFQDKLKMIDKDGDGAVSKAEFASAAASRMEDGPKKPGKDGKEGNSTGGVKPKRPTE